MAFFTGAMANRIRFTHGTHSSTQWVRRRQIDVASARAAALAFRKSARAKSANFLAARWAAVSTAPWLAHRRESWIAPINKSRRTGHPTRNSIIAPPLRLAVFRGIIFEGSLVRLLFRLLREGCHLDGAPRHGGDDRGELVPELVAEDVHDSDRRDCHQGDDDDVFRQSLAAPRGSHIPCFFHRDIPPSFCDLPAGGSKGRSCLSREGADEYPEKIREDVWRNSGIGGKTDLREV